MLRIAVCVFQMVEDIGFEPMRIIDACKAPEVNHCSNPPFKWLGWLDSHQQGFPADYGELSWTRTNTQCRRHLP